MNALLKVGDELSNNGKVWTVEKDSGNNTFVVKNKEASDDFKQMVVYPLSDLHDNEKKETWDRKHKLHKQLEAATFVQLVDSWDEASYKVCLLDYCMKGSVEQLLKTRKYLH